MPAIDWEHAPEFPKISREELEACAISDWYELAYANGRIMELESLVRDMYTANRKLRDEIDRDRCVAGLDVKCRADEVMAWLDEIVDERRMRELGITESEES